MTASPRVTVFCDASDCGQWDGRGEGPTARDARAGLKNRGWRLGVPNPQGGSALDFCPLHPDTPLDVLVDAAAASRTQV